MKDMLLNAMRSTLEGRVDYHRANIAVYLENPVGIGEHPDIMEAVESELAKLSEADEKLATLDKYFP